MVTDRWTLIVNADQVTEEILDAATKIIDGHYQTGRVDWDDVLYRLEGFELPDGTKLDLGQDERSPAIKKIKKHVKDYRAL